MTRLKTETNTPDMAERIAEAFGVSDQAIPHDDCRVCYEHGQHFVTCIICGAQWSVVDAEGGPAIDGFDFEQLSEGDGFCEDGE